MSINDTINKFKGREKKKISHRGLQTYQHSIDQNMVRMQVASFANFSYFVIVFTSISQYCDARTCLTLELLSCSGQSCGLTCVVFLRAALLGTVRPWGCFRGIGICSCPCCGRAPLWFVFMHLVWNDGP
jgi:hypothetical protein